MIEASNDVEGDATEPGWVSRREHGSGISSLTYPDGSVRIRHRCDRGARGVIYAAPALQLSNSGHVVAQPCPLTVVPSILCGDCNLHGFITDGVWSNA